MSLESANLINELDPTWPTATDPVSQGDDHMRMIKHVLQTQFPNLTNAVTASSDDLNSGANPAGSLIMYGGATVPTGYLMCNGAEVSRTTYSDLYIAIGTAYGDGDGSNTFNVPDMLGNVAGGASPNDALGDLAGKNTWADTDLPAHGHAIADSGQHTHKLEIWDNASPPAGPTKAIIGTVYQEEYIWSDVHTDDDGSHTHTASNTGTGGDNRQATLYVNYIIKT